jgi:hypothetical protein
MEGFKSNLKMQCFKEGGQVKYETRKEHKEEMKADIAQDKAIVKKAFKIHDTQSHEGKKTNLSKLRKGGRAKKDCGTVKKYQAGGSVSNVYEAKKDSGDKDVIQKVKQIKPTVAAAKSAPVGKPKNTAAKYCGGGMAKYQAGGSVDVKDPQALTDKIAREENLADRELVMGPLRAAKNAAKKFLGMGSITDKEREIVGRAAAPSAPVNQSSGTFNKRNGGKVKKMNTGGTCS